MKRKLFVIICGLMVAGTARADRNQDPAQREAFHQAMEACHTETGTARPTRGSPPNEADRAKMDACMTAKGFSKPDRPHGGEHRRPASVDNQNQNYNGEGAGAIQ